jgi:hypothetical protein
VLWLLYCSLLSSAFPALMLQIRLLILLRALAVLVFLNIFGFQQHFCSQFAVNAAFG